MRARHGSSHPPHAAGCNLRKVNRQKRRKREMRNETAAWIMHAVPPTHHWQETVELIAPGGTGALSFRRSLNTCLRAPLSFLYFCGNFNIIAREDLIITARRENKLCTSCSCRWKRVRRVGRRSGGAFLVSHVSQSEIAATGGTSRLVLCRIRALISVLVSFEMNAKGWVWRWRKSKKLINRKFRLSSLKQFIWQSI